MPRMPVHTEKMRRDILFHAARILRVGGPEKLGVAALMAEVGLTHGGFYAYFSSKDDLLAQAITTINEERHRYFLSVTEGKSPEDALGDYIDAYTASHHRDVLEDSCAIPALASYVPQMSPTCRARFADGVDRLEQGLAKLISTLGRKSARDLAGMVVASLAGAIVLARSSSNMGHSDRILKNSRQFTKQLLQLQ